MPGNTEGHHWPVTTFWKPMAIMLPHSGVGATTPAPTKLRPGGQQHRPADIDRELRHQGRDGVGDDVAPQDRHVRRAGDIGRLDIAQLADRQHLAAHQPQVDRHVHEGDGDHDALHALAEHGDQGDGEDEDRKRLQHVGGAHHRGAERPPPRPLAFVVADRRRRWRRRLRPTPGYRSRRWRDRRAARRARGSGCPCRCRRYPADGGRPAAAGTRWDRRSSGRTGAIQGASSAIRMTPTTIA